MVQEIFLNFEAEREAVETAVVEAVGFGDVYCYSGRQTFDVSQVANVEEAHGERDAVVIVAVVDVDVEVPEESEARKSVGAVSERKEPFEGAQVVEHIVENNQLMADMGYMLAELAEVGDTAVAVAVAVDAFANDYFEIHSHNSHIGRFVQQGAGKAEVESTEHCKVQQEVVHVVVVQQYLPTMPNNLAAKAAEEEEVQEAAEAAEA